MKLLAYSTKTIILMNVVLSVALSLILGLGFIVPALQIHTLLQNKLVHLMAVAHKVPEMNSERLINFTELLKILKINPLAALEVVSATQEQGEYHLVLRGTLALFTAFVKRLAASTLVTAMLTRTLDGYTLKLTLKDLRIDANPQSMPEAVVAPKVVGSVTRSQHHYCVLEDSAHKIHLSERVSC